MPESTLNTTFSQLEADAGAYLGFGRGAVYSETAWSTRAQADITDCVKSGYRKFLFPSPLPGEHESYDWSFLRPVRQLLMESGSTTLAMPDDCGGLEGRVRLVDSTRRPIEIQITNDQMVALQYSLTPDQTGTPLMCAIRNIPPAGQTRGPRQELFFFPAADQSYTVEVQYYLSPDALTTSFPYAHGGTVHAETIKASVLAAAEIYKDNQPGPMAANFVDQMRKSVSLDRRNKGQTFGVVTDPGYNADRMGYPGWRHYEQGQPITYGGVSPG